MDKVEEVKKLKQLLDDGIIDEEDFAKKKAELLGISRKEENNESVTENIKSESEDETKSLEEYEKELIAQSEMEKENNEVASTKSNDDYYQKEKLKAKAKLDAEEELRKQRRQEQKVVVDKGVNKIKAILKWVLAVTLWIFGVTSVFAASESGMVYIPMGIIMIIQGCMACPKITDKTKKFETYTRYKTFLVIITVIVWVALAVIFPSTTDTVNNNQIKNNTTYMQ